MKIIVDVGTTYLSLLPIGQINPQKTVVIGSIIRNWLAVKLKKRTWERLRLIWQCSWCSEINEKIIICQGQMLLAFYRMSLVSTLLGHSDPYWLPKAKAVMPQFWEFIARSLIWEKRRRRRRDVKREVRFRTSAHPRVLGNTASVLPLWCLAGCSVLFLPLFLPIERTFLETNQNWWWPSVLQLRTARLASNGPGCDCTKAVFAHRAWKEILKLCPGTRGVQPTGENWGSLVQGLPQREQGFSVHLLHSVCFRFCSAFTRERGMVKKERPTDKEQIE